MTKFSRTYLHLVSWLFYLLSNHIFLFLLALSQGWTTGLAMRPLLHYSFYAWLLFGSFNQLPKKSVTLSWPFFCVTWGCAGNCRTSINLSPPVATASGVSMTIAFFHISSVVHSFEVNRSFEPWQNSTQTFQSSIDQMKVPVLSVLHPPLPPTNLYFMAIMRIFDVKYGPFHEHSYQLHSIASGVPNWSKVNSGLFKMYEVGNFFCFHSPFSNNRLIIPRPKC